MKSRVVLCFFILLIIPAFALAGEKEQLAEELIGLKEMGKISDQIQNQLMKDLDQSMRQFNIPEHQKAKALEFHSRMNKVILDEVSWTKMKDDYVRLYAQVYTAQEMKDLIKFHKSPVGRMMIRKEPIIVEKSMAVSQKRLDALIPKLEEMMDEFKRTL